MALGETYLLSHWPDVNMGNDNAYNGVALSEIASNYINCFNS